MPSEQDTDGADREPCSRCGEPAPRVPVDLRGFYETPDGDRYAAHSGDYLHRECAETVIKEIESGVRQRRLVTDGGHEQETEELQHDWEVGLGAVLYNDRHDRREDRRDFWHVTSRFVDVDHGGRLYELWDGTHTRRRYYLAEDLLADFAPAGWQCNPGRKPLYLLTRRHGVQDRADKMTFDDYFEEA